MENPNHKWRFLAGKIIYFYGLFSMRVNPNKGYVTVLVLHPALGSQASKKWSRFSQFPWQDCYRTPTERWFSICWGSRAQTTSCRDVRDFGPHGGNRSDCFLWGCYAGQPHHNTRPTQPDHTISVEDDGINCLRWWFFPRLAFLKKGTWKNDEGHCQFWSMFVARCPC